MFDGVAVLVIRAWMFWLFFGVLVVEAVLAAFNLYMRFRLKRDVDKFSVYLKERRDA
jgi:uncharacterized membrane protein